MQHQDQPAGIDVDATVRRVQAAMNGQDQSDQVQRMSREIVVRASVRAQAMTASAEATLADAQAQADQLLHDATLRAEQLLKDAERIHAEAGEFYRQTVETAFSEREAVKAQTLNEIARLAGRLMRMADDVVAVADDPAIAQIQLAQFVLALGQAAERVDAEV